MVVEDGDSVHEIKNFDRKVDIEKLYEKVYNKFKSEIEVKSLLEAKVLDEIYKKGVFEYVEKK